MKEINFSDDVTCVEKDDGMWWYYCPNPKCGYDIGRYKMEAPIALAQTEEDRKKRCAPRIQIPVYVVCIRCETRMALRRCEINITIPK